MSAFKPEEHQALDTAVVEQAMLWMVALQSGVSDAAQQQACQHWRQESPQHELAWQRLAGLNRDLRDSTSTLPASSARRLLQARSTSSRRMLLKGFVGLGVAAATGFSVRERVLLPELFSDYRTTTGERRQFQLAGDIQFNMDTQTALDVSNRSHPPVLTLNLGRILLAVGAGNPIRVKTANGWIQPTTLSRLIISHDLDGLPGTQVQVLTGSALVAPLHGDSFAIGTNQQRAFDSNRSGLPGHVAATAEAWAKGLLIADRMPLAEVVTQLDRYRRGLLRCDPAVAGLQVSGSLSLDNPDASLDLLASILPIRVQRVFGYWATVVPA